jgi:hypothetical protein
MAVPILNPLTGNLDFVGTGGGGGSPTIQTPNYTLPFTTTDFTGPVSGNYILTILATTHGKGLHPIIQIFEDIGGGLLEIVVAPFTVDGSGNVRVLITSSPDQRFNGKCVLSENN